MDHWGHWSLASSLRPTKQLLCGLRKEAVLFCGRVYRPGRLWGPGGGSFVGAAVAHSCTRQPVQLFFIIPSGRKNAYRRQNISIHGCFRPLCKEMRYKSATQGCLMVKLLPGPKKYEGCRNYGLHKCVVTF